MIEPSQSSVLFVDGSEMLVLPKSERREQGEKRKKRRKEETISQRKQIIFKDVQRS